MFIDVWSGFRGIAALLVTVLGATTGSIDFTSEPGGEEEILVVEEATVTDEYDAVPEESQDEEPSDPLEEELDPSEIDLSALGEASAPLKTEDFNEPVIEARQAITFNGGAVRLAGQDRYNTSLAISKKYAPGVRAVFVATGTNFADALSGSALAAMHESPLILTTPNKLPPSVNKEIKRLKPEKIFILGGTGSVSKTVERDLQKIATVTRYAGSDRYATSIDLIQKSYSKSETVFVATGRDFPDALAAAAAAGKMNAPVLLVDGAQKSLPKQAINLLQKLGAKRVYIAGLQGAVTDAIRNQIQKNGASVTRLGGVDRFATASAINKKFFAAGELQAGSDVSFYATGFNFPDALSAAALAGSQAAPIFLVKNGCVPGAEIAVARNFDTQTKVLVGGETLVGGKVAALTRCADAAEMANIWPGERLAPGESRKSANGKHSIKFEKSGNVLVSNAGRKRWESGDKAGAGAELLFADDGSLKLIEGNKTQTVIPASQGAGFLQIGNDGNLVIKNVSGKSLIWSLSTAKPKRINNSGPGYFAQNDPKWSGVQIGNGSLGGSGCVPTAFAMAIQGYGFKASPVDVGRVMNQHGDFNRTMAGAGSKSIVTAASYYGLMVTPLKSFADVEKALKEKRSVIALVAGPANIVLPPATHAVVLYGYSNGNTALKNPYRHAYQGTYSLKTLWEKRSRDSFDLNAGAVFWAIG